MRLLKRCLQTMKRAPGTGGSSRFTRVGRQVYATINGVVVLVGRWGLTGVLPGCLVVNVGVIYKRNVRCGVLYSKLWMSHEIVDGGSGFRFFQAFIEGATKCVHNTNLHEERDQCQRVEMWAGRPPSGTVTAGGGKGHGPTKNSKTFGSICKFIYSTVHWDGLRISLKRM